MLLESRKAAGNRRYGVGVVKDPSTQDAGAALPPDGETAEEEPMDDARAAQVLVGQRY